MYVYVCACMCVCVCLFCTCVKVYEKSARAFGVGSSCVALRCVALCCVVKEFQGRRYVCGRQTLPPRNKRDQVIFEVRDLRLKLGLTSFIVVM